MPELWRRAGAPPEASDGGTDLSRTHEPLLPAEPLERIRAEFEPDQDVVSVMLLHHVPGTDPTTFKPGVLAILVRDDAERRAASIVGRATSLLGRYAEFVPVVCLTLSEHGEHPLRLRGGSALIRWRSQ